MKHVRWFWLTVLFLAGTVFPQNAGTETPLGSITAASLKERVYFLSSEKLEGRYPGSAGYGIAAAYAVSQFRADDVPPAVPERYEQKVSMVRRTVQQPLTATLRTPGGERRLGENEMKIMTAEGLSSTEITVPVIFAGFGIHEPAVGWDDLKGLDLAGKAVVILPGVPLREGRAILPEPYNRQYAALNAVMRKWATLRGVALLLTLPDQEIAKFFDRIPPFPQSPQFVLSDSAPGAFLGAPSGFLSLEGAKALFGEKGAPTVEAVAQGRFPRGELPGVTLTLKAAVSDEPVESFNIIGRVEGTDPQLKEQVVVVSAHLDHLMPVADGRINPGANDNASGAAALLEIARAVAVRRPRRSVVFALFTGEEGGSMGARAFLSRGPVPKDRIVADLNLDMLGRTEEALLAEGTQYVLDSDRHVPAFRKLIEEVNAQTVKWPLRFEHPLNLGNSDHYIFDAEGIPAVNFYSGKVAETHKPTDTADRIDYRKLENLARLVCAITFELANRDPLW